MNDLSKLNASAKVERGDASVLKYEKLYFLGFSPNNTVTAMVVSKGF